jgi:acetolactate synthase-1/3 small subunit
MTIVVDAQQVNVALIAANLRKLVNVIEVRLVSDMPHVSRDLALIKVRSNNAESANAITSICERYPARIVDIGPEVAIVEITAQEHMVEEMIEELRPVGIVEMVRTGVVAMGRGVRIQDTEHVPTVIPKSAAANGHKYSV